MTAYLGLQDPDYNRLLRQSEQSTGAVTNDQLENAAPPQQVAEQWIQLSNSLRYILVSTCDGPASTICRQNMQGNGFETWRLVHARYSIPLGTRSIGYFTKLLKPQLDEQKFEESFTTWEFQLSRYEQDNNTLLPDAIKIAVLLNETKGPLQQHLQLQAALVLVGTWGGKGETFNRGGFTNRLLPLQAPKQPTPQEILEHNVTHLPYRNWCPICVQSRGRQNNHPKQHSKLPIIQLDFGYIKGFDDNKVHPILTASDIQSGMIMAIQLTDKRMLFDYAVTQLQNFLIECGRTTHTILQSDQEDFLTAFITTVASKSRNMNSGYSSQSQGGVERAHRTLFAQIRTLKAQIKQNYNRDIPMKHPLMPWIVRHSAYIMNRYALHSNGCTSYFNRWNREQHTPLCEFGETVQYMLPTVKQFPKLVPRFYNGIWLGKDTTTNPSSGSTTRLSLPTPTLTPPVTMPSASETTTSQKDAATSAAAENKRQSAAQSSEQQPKQKRTAEPTSPMATSPAHQKRASLPAPPHASQTRERDDTIAEGSAGKQQRTTAERQTLERPTTAEQPKSKMRINAIKFTTKDGKQMETTSNEDTQEIENERILLEPITHDTEDLDPQLVAQGMKKEVEQMREQSVFTEIDGNTMTPEQQANIIESRWVLKPKHNEVRARIVAKGYTEPVTDHDLLFASTPLFCILRVLLTMALVYNWSVCTGDASVAFLHAAAITHNLVMRPPHQFYNEENRHIMWRLNKAIYGLRSSPKQWQDHIAHVLTVTLELVRCTTESNVCRSKGCLVYIMIYVDDLLFIGVQSLINSLFSRIQKEEQTHRRPNSWINNPLPWQKHLTQR